MTGKRSKEIENKRRHISDLRDARQKRREEPRLERCAAYKNPKPLILIVCEGENTEPSYFNQFRLSTATIRALGKGYNTIGVVKHAEQLAKAGIYDEVWVVFDKDSNPAQNYNNAIKMAAKRGFFVAYSNQAFEYWFILHFNDHQGGKLHRSQYHGMINQYIGPFGVTYDGKGNKRVSPEFFALLNEVDPITKKPRVNLAIKRAKEIYRKLSHQKPSEEESSTTVFMLVEKILQHL